MINPLSLIYEAVLDEVWKKEFESRAFLLAVSGAEAVGKTQFCSELAEHLNHSVNTTVVHLDNFFFPTKLRNFEADEIVNYLERSVDFDRFQREILIPLRNSAQPHLTSQLYDFDIDGYVGALDVQVRPPHVIILEGTMMLRRQFAHFFDMKVHLTAEEAERIERGVKRDAARLGKDVRRRFMQKYIPGYIKFEQLHDPKSIADFEIENSNFLSRQVFRS